MKHQVMLEPPAEVTREARPDMQPQFIVRTAPIPQLDHPWQQCGLAFEEDPDMLHARWRFQPLPPSDIMFSCDTLWELLEGVEAWLDAGAPRTFHWPLD